MGEPAGMPGYVKVVWGLSFFSLVRVDTDPFLDGPEWKLYVSKLYYGVSQHKASKGLTPAMAHRYGYTKVL